jgi:membrane associated rhomboid family serine protease
MMAKKQLVIAYNAPVILSLTLIALIVLLLNGLLGGRLNILLSAHFTSWFDPFMYLRLVTYVFAHSNFDHFAGNFVLMLAVGPIVEEKYGSKRLLIMLLITAAMAGFVSTVFSTNTALIGASGLVFMLILLASFTNMQAGTLPLTFILVALLYVGNEVVTAITVRDNISQLAHVAGAACGCGFGLITQGGKKK